MKIPIVIKIGTGVLTRENGTLDGASLVRLVTAVAELKAAGHACVMVSSGAVGAGVSSLNLTSPTVSMQWSNLPPYLQNSCCPSLCMLLDQRDVAVPFGRSCTN